MKQHKTNAKTNGKDTHLQMKTLTDRQLIGMLITVLLIMIGLLTWQFSQPRNCWDNYLTEQQAIQHCERH